MALSLALHGLAVVLLFAAGASGGAGTGDAALVVDLAFAAAPATSPSASPSPSPATSEGPAEPEKEQVEPPLEQAADHPLALPAPDEPPPVELSRERPVELPAPEEPPPPDFSELKAPEPPPPQDPPPARTADAKPAEPPRPAPQPQPQQKSNPAPRPPAASADKARTRTGAPAAAASSRATAPSGPPQQTFGGSGAAQQAAAGFLPVPAIVFEGKPRFRHPPTPAVYPPRAIELNQQGEALVRVRLDAQGNAVEVVLHRSSGHHMLDKAALAAVRGWHFLPAVRDGRPVPSWVEIPVRFRLR